MAKQSPGDARPVKAEPRSERTTIFDGGMLFAVVSAALGLAVFLAVGSMARF